MHSGFEGSSASLNRQILNNSLERTALKDLCERLHKHKQLLVYCHYTDIGYISRNRHKARSSQLLPLPKDTEETHEILSADLQVSTSSTE
jgi:hypothetical protein